MKKCDNCGDDFEGESHTPVDENFTPQKGIMYCTKCYGESLVKRTVVLQQDDCDPDSLEAFEKAFETKFGRPFEYFRKRAERFEDDYSVTYTLGRIEASIEAGHPWWVVFKIE